MSTNVMPLWLKFFMFSAILAAFWWCFAGQSDYTTYANVTYMTTNYEMGGGLQSRAGANIRQFVTNPLEPVSLPDDSIMVLRRINDNYYQDEP